MTPVIVFVTVVAIAGCGASSPGRSELPGATVAKVAASSVEDLAGRPAPPFSLASARGSGVIVVPSPDVTVVVFIGSWSIGSNIALAQLEALREKYAKDGLRVVAVSMDETMEQATRFAETNGAGVSVAWSGGMTAKANTEWSSGPYGRENSVFILDRGGIVRSVHRGGKDFCAGDRPEVESAIVRLLAEAR